MQVRFAQPEDATEIVRLAALMFESMGIMQSDARWEEDGRRSVRERLGDDLAAFVVDHPDEAGRLIASVSGTINHRLPGPFVPSGRVGYVQWVCTDPLFRGRGLARLAMEAMLDWYESRDVKTAELHATPIAEHLYLSLGFDDSGPRALRRTHR